MHQLINPTLARSIHADRLQARRFAGANYRRPSQPRPPDPWRAKVARAAARAAVRLDSEAAKRAVA